MKMTDWLERLQHFLSMTGRDILDHAGKISRDEALEKAHREYTNFKGQLMEAPSTAEKAFLKATETELKALENKRRLSHED